MVAIVIGEVSGALGDRVGEVLLLGGVDSGGDFLLTHCCGCSERLQRSRHNCAVAMMRVILWAGSGR